MIGATLDIIHPNSWTYQFLICVGLLQFVADGVMYAELNEMLMHELAEDGYSGVEIRKTLMRTEIIIRATRCETRLVLSV